MPKRLRVAYSGMLAYRAGPSDQGNQIAGPSVLQYISFEIGRLCIYKNYSSIKLISCLYII